MRASMRNYRIRQEYEKKRRLAASGAERSPSGAEWPEAEEEEIITPLPPEEIGIMDRIKQYFRTLWSRICQQFQDLRQ